MKSDKLSGAVIKTKTEFQFGFVNNKRAIVFKPIGRGTGAQIKKSKTMDVHSLSAFLHSDPSWACPSARKELLRRRCVTFLRGKPCWNPSAVARVHAERRLKDERMAEGRARALERLCSEGRTVAFVSGSGCVEDDPPESLLSTAFALDVHRIASTVDTTPWWSGSVGERLLGRCVFSRTRLEANTKYHCGFDGENAGLRAQGEVYPPLRVVVDGSNVMFSLAVAAKKRGLSAAGDAAGRLVRSLRLANCEPEVLFDFGSGGGLADAKYEARLLKRLTQGDVMIGSHWSMFCARLFEILGVRVGHISGVADPAIAAEAMRGGPACVLTGDCGFVIGTGGRLPVVRQVHAPGLKEGAVGEARLEWLHHRFYGYCAKSHPLFISNIKSGFLCRYSDKNRTLDARAEWAEADGYDLHDGWGKIREAVLSGDVRVRPEPSSRSSYKCTLMSMVAPYYSAAFVELGGKGDLRLEQPFLKLGQVARRVIRPYAATSKTRRRLRDCDAPFDLIAATLSGDVKARDALLDRWCCAACISGKEADRMIEPLLAKARDWMPVTTSCF